MKLIIEPLPVPVRALAVAVPIADAEPKKKNGPSDAPGPLAKLKEAVKCQAWRRRKISREAALKPIKLAVAGSGTALMAMLST